MHDIMERGALEPISFDFHGNRPRPSPPRSCANVLGVPVDALDMEGAISRIVERLQFGPRGYVCAIGVHGILEGLRDRSVAQALANAAIRLPDGAPTVWVGRWQGHRTMDHVTGPAIMRQVFSRREFAGYSHFFYGGKAGVAEELASTMRRQFPRIHVSGTYTPPFRNLTPGEESALVARINDSRPDIIWVGISTPRQDLFMQRMIPRLNTRLMFGVGAAFDFLTGHIHDCPNCVKRAGLNWLPRLAQDPRRLWRRNLTNTAFLWHIGLQLTGLRSYPLWEARKPDSDDNNSDRQGELCSSCRERDQ
jgi:N-acetylglucosaminyldiphosphoundecaprenol N-acetyl-beta-D-mannosaminyltransferase